MASEVYTIKKVLFQGANVPICMQCQNGPCPLLGMFNTLSLRGQLKLDKGKVRPKTFLPLFASFVQTGEAQAVLAIPIMAVALSFGFDQVDRGFFTSRDLLGIIGDFLLSRNRSCMEKKDGMSANQRQVLNDVLSNVLPKLQVGLDVNVKFGQAIPLTLL
jgi:hypothetical protein